MNMKNKSLAFLATILFCSWGANAQTTEAEPEYNKSLQDVVVSSSKSDLSLKKIPQKVEIITKEDIKQIPVTNVADLLKTLANVDLIQYPGANATVGIRGFKPSGTLRSYTLLLIDGKPAGTANIATIPTAFVERVEVVKGPYSVLYGSDAMGGIVNIITKKVDNNTNTSVQVGYGEFERSDINATLNIKPLDNLGFAFGFSRSVQGEDYRIGKRNLINDVNYEKHLLAESSYGDKMGATKYSINNYAAKMQYDINDVWNLGITSLYSTSPEIQTPGNYWHSYGEQKVKFKRANFMFDLVRSSYNNTLTISPYYSSDQRDTYTTLAEDAYVIFSKATHEDGLKISDLQKWDNFSLVGGIDVDRLAVIGKNYSAKDVLKAPYTPDYNILSTSAYIQGNYEYEGLLLNAGLRYNFTRFGVEKNTFLKNKASNRYYNNLAPSLGLRYDIIPEVSIHASAGVGYYIPDAYQVSGNYETSGSYGKKYRGNPNLKAETSNSVDGGVSFYKDNWFTADVTYFYTLYKNKIVEETKTDAQTSDKYVTYTNAPEAKMHGIEIALSLDVLKAMGGYTDTSLSLYANYTHMFYNKYQEPKKNNALVDLLYVRKDLANFGVKFDYDNMFGARINGRFIGNRLENNWFTYGNTRPWDAASNYTQGGYVATDNIVKHPKHLIFDVSAYYNVSKVIKLGVTASNLLDENYSEKDGYNMPGRCIMGTLSFNISE